MTSVRLELIILIVDGMKGITMANYVKLDSFIKDPATNKITGAEVFDKINKKKIKIRAKVVVNATGINSDKLRAMDQGEDVEKLIIGSRGTHIILSDNEKAKMKDHHGIIIPKTKDGRLIYIINYLGVPMIGTTDEQCDLTEHVEAP